MDPKQDGRCGGGHDIYVVECVYIAKDGKIAVVAICRSCGAVIIHEKVITAPHTQAVLLKEKEK